MAQLDIRAETDAVDSILFADSYAGNADRLIIHSSSARYITLREGDNDDMSIDINVSDITNLIAALRKIKELIVD